MSCSSVSYDRKARKMPMAGPVDRHLVDQLVTEHLPAALRLAQRLTNDANTAEDVVQEALCRVLGRWKSFRGDASFKTWMLQIVVNVDRDRRRRRREFHEILPDLVVSTTAGPSDNAAAEELCDAIRVAIHNLPERQREVALLSLGEGLETTEVAAILQTTEANVHTCLHLARKRIAKAIGVNYVQRK
jgi:RNA polymerase sigma-70 factor (ECF subfamily)